eukprot:8061619-Pyramimonas_sp.AAC.1
MCVFDGPPPDAGLPERVADVGGGAGDDHHNRKMVEATAGRRCEFSLVSDGVPGRQTRRHGDVV